MGRIAQAEEKPVIVPPFQAPGEAEIHERLKKAGLSEDGMEILILNGKELQRPSTVGWVYWGRLYHTARDKIHVSPSGPPQRQDELEYYALRDVGAFENLAEHFNTRAAVAGIGAELQGEKLRFRLAEPQGATLKLACPVSHPWLLDQEVRVGPLIISIP